MTKAELKDKIATLEERISENLFAADKWQRRIGDFLAEQNAERYYEGEDFWEARKGYWERRIDEMTERVDEAYGEISEDRREIEELKKQLA